MNQHKYITSATLLWQNSLKLSTFDIKHSQLMNIINRYYSSKIRDTNLLRNDEFKQIIPVGNSIKNLESICELPKNSKIKKSIIVKVQKPILAKKDKEELSKKKLIINQKKEDRLKRLKLHKQLTETAPLIVPVFVQSAYMHFTQNEFAKIKNDLKDPTLLLKSKKILKDISVSWKLMTEAEKLKHEQKYKLLKEQYTIELYKWWDNVDKNLIKLENRRRRSINKINKGANKHKLSMLVDPRRLKKPANITALFLIDFQKLNDPEAPTKRVDFVKYCAAKWKLLPETEKNKYRDKYMAAVKLYKEASKKCN
ncbi:hypothetical protein BB561_006610 [Smittium simulii]|uniref:HMG box domain-containing protein n=1 Tax=Smittium simulii TaxID=133385 RepID=A0A2T9Y2X4_9FUNG|nr:hypothetical protein BB561_006610 [Smittium simulii]